MTFGFVYKVTIIILDWGKERKLPDQ